ncbi:MAG: NUDIX hydrolase [Rhodospirillaceae bacterium]|mgnify:FL=1|nr:NUDIX hydrolase [Rhodospirillaceae bacterium]
MLKPPPIQQSCVVPYFLGVPGLEIALITSRNTGRWIVPKGTVEPNMTPQASAAKEALEEAGLLGEPGRESLGEYFYSKFDQVYRVQIFPFQVTRALDDWDEKHFRRRVWVSAEEAIERITEAAVQEAIRQMTDTLEWPGVPA